MAKLLKFYNDRRPRWRRLDDLLGELDLGVSLGGQKADELYRLYRLTASDLAFMQTHTGNPALLDYLEDLVARAHVRLTPSESPRILQGIYRTLRYDFPALVNREARLLVLAIVVFLAGALFGAVVSLVEPASVETFLSAFPNLLDQTPSEDAARRFDTSLDLASSVAFSVQLFFHNLRVSVLCFALGLTFGIGTAVVLFINGVILGSVAAIYAQDGVILFFLAWVGPHGSLEIPETILAGMTGFMLARAQLSGGGGIWKKIVARKRDFVTMLAGCALLLMFAGGIEGGFSQTHSPSIVTLKISVGVLCFLGLVTWLFILPRRGSADDQSSMRPALTDR